MRWQNSGMTWSLPMSGPTMLCGRMMISRSSTPVRAHASDMISHAILPPPYEKREFSTSGTVRAIVSGVGTTDATWYVSEEDTSIRSLTPCCSHALRMFSIPRIATSRTRRGCS